MLLHFTKMHGLGNDFMVVDLVTQRARLDSHQVRELADRHFGIGFDQLLLVEPPRHPDMDFRYRIFNADGGEVENCGNGARCFARFVLDQRLTRKRELKVETSGGPLTLKVGSDDRITVEMGTPVLEASQVPFEAKHDGPKHQLRLDTPIDGIEQVEFGVVSMGNPHAVLLVDSVATAPVATLGPVLESHRRFPNRVNVGFMEVVDRRHIRLRVFERGVGETLACGTGACAAVVTGIQQGLLDQRVEVELPGGRLTIEWPGEGHQVVMTGPAEKVFDGRLEL
ncbi:diaminopimelate epimerase [Halotalea alkalilenta]|uniref:Diaminopimelate epimerase n=1 Tax=Halotalea alkalilenta TaxID=376489 RepID=A0A172YC17_9GAMM|nr:diaminopimelate epimerase [Halotalea alkalilenta]ANF56764.1 diaminopimelate epimerase [Halotalea alkalilenta]